MKAYMSLTIYYTNYPTLVTQAVLFSYVHFSNCPDDLAAIITHHATQELLEVDLTCYNLKDNKGLGYYDQLLDKMYKISKYAFFLYCAYVCNREKLCSHPIKTTSVCIF